MSGSVKLAGSSVRSSGSAVKPFDVPKWLVMEAWEKGNYLEYTLSAVSPEDPIHFRLEVALTLDAVHEAWETIRVSAEKLREYYLIAALAYVRKEGLLGKHFTCERTSPTSYKLTLQSEG